MKTKIQTLMALSTLFAIGCIDAKGGSIEVLDLSQLEQISGGEVCKCINTSRTDCSYNPSAVCETEPAEGPVENGVICKFPDASIYRAVGQRIKDENCLRSPNPNDNCTISDASFCVDEQRYKCFTLSYTFNYTSPVGEVETSVLRYLCASRPDGSAYQAGTRKKGAGQHCP